MFTNILVPIDSSEISDRILKSLKKIQTGTEIKVELFTAVSPDVTNNTPLQLRIKHAEKKLDTLQKALQTEQCIVTKKVVMGEPVDRILNRLKTDQFDLVAMATHGRSGISRMYWGSIAENVLRQCHVPLLLLHPSLSEQPNQVSPVKKILFPTDGSEFANSIIPMAQHIAKFNAAELIMLHVKADDQAVNEASPFEKSLKDVLEGFAKTGVTVEPRVLLGDPAQVILDVIEKEDIDLVMISTHGRDRFDRWKMGSVAEHVLRHCHTPMLMKRTSEIQPETVKEQSTTSA
ncbi:MAG: universal stress protein [Planctomycetota bacterium]|nr:universal stress protein [Planctomycetota bacterium]